MKSYCDVPYAVAYGTSGRLDLQLPEQSTGRPVIMVIHGGGLTEFSKERMAGIVERMVAHGYPVVNINYRLLPASPFPAPVQDCLRAFRWIKTSAHAELQTLDRSRIVVLGASAGGYLALMTGMLLGPSEVRGIVSISGPTQPGWYGKDAERGGHDPRLFLSPAQLVGPKAPPVLAVHSRNDKLVPTDESIRLVEQMRIAGRQAQLYLFDGPGDLHGIWENTQEPLYLLPPIEQAIVAFLETL